MIRKREDHIKEKEIKEKAKGKLLLYPSFGAEEGQMGE